MSTSSRAGRRPWLAGAAAAVLMPLPLLRARAEDRPVLRFGLTPVFLDERTRLLQRWRDYLEPALQASVTFVQRGTYGQVMDAVRGGEAHFAWICGYPYVLHQRELALVAVPQWRGRPLFQSYLIADATGRVRTLADLRGASFAYSDPLSNSGFLYMQHRLRGLGEDSTRFFGRSFFTHSHRHVVEAVAAGLADGGSVDGYVWETLAELQPELTARTRVVDRSPDFGFPPIVAGARTEPARVRAFAAALLAMSQNPAGQAVLRELRLDRFVSAEPALFAGIAAMARQQAAT